MNSQLFLQKVNTSSAILDLYQNVNMMQTMLSLITVTSRPYQTTLFREQSIQLLQQRSQSIARTKEYAEFERRLESMPDPTSFESMLKAFETTPSLGKPANSQIRSFSNSTSTSVLLPRERTGTSFGEPKETEKTGRQFLEDQILSEKTHSGVSDSNLKEELENMTKSLLKNIGKESFGSISEKRKQYAHSKILLEAYDALVKKYFSSKKVREDIVRYVIRKAFKAIKRPLAQNKKVQGKKASLLLCKKYFADHFEENGDEESEDIVESFMPYNVKSKNKTMNTNFVQEIFSSEEFSKDYQEFLPGLDETLEKDNEKKFKKLIEALLQCAKKKDFSKVSTLKVFPWLDIWVKETKEVARQLSEENSISANKKLKC